MGGEENEKNDLPEPPRTVSRCSILLQKASEYQGIQGEKERGIYPLLSGSKSGLHFHEEWCRTEAKSLPNPPGTAAPVASLATYTLGYDFHINYW